MLVPIIGQHHQRALLPLLGLAAWTFSGVDAITPLRDLCPVTCLDAGPNPSNWTVVAEFAQLQACPKPLVLDFSVRVPIGTKQHIRVCNMFINDFDNLASSDIALASTVAATEIKQVNPQLAWTPAASEGEIGGRLVVQSVGHLKSYLANSGKADKRIVLFGTVSGTTAGVYIGANVIGSSVAGDLFDSFLNNLYSTGIADSKAALVQLCEGRHGDDIIGLIAASSASFSTVHDAVGRWSNGTCVDTSSYAETRELNATAVAVIKAKYNPTIVCDDMLPGQFVCCTSGSIPDTRPKPQADGSCFPYQNKDDDWCHKVAVTHGLTVEELIDLNKDTWGFNGCGLGFWAGNWICLSTGTPPFPAPISNAVCGPQKPGTTKPSGSTSRDWAKLNPCPLNSCCNVWGQCGTTVDFCIDTNTGPPGTAKVDTYGCISNCGMSIVRSGPPAQFIKLGYFEGFNLGRECLNMDATQIDPSYTHVHFAFGMISAQFEVYQEDIYSEFQFQQFKKITTAKRIISFGNAVSTAANREKLATNLVGYVINNGLDGLDIDWEYPAAPDLPDIPKGDLSEAVNYLRLLATIRSKLPKDKTLSIAAPSSYWYLKQFPIKAMAELLDYIVYMTYDLHGQWDAGNKWASPGCPTGNCLRSHINRTETLSALTLITKAGVPSNKVLVGISSYGRSFQMVDPSCTGPSCQFTGDKTTSYARPGRCTKTNGYLANAEIDEIGGRTWTDVSSNSIIKVDGDLWVSYMDNSLKESRTQLYKNYQMGGTIDWAVDLVKFHMPPYGVTPVTSPATSPGTFLQHWSVAKARIGEGETVEEIACYNAEEVRTGDWVNKSCEDLEGARPYRFTSSERWELYDCQNAWNDVVNAYNACKASWPGSFTLWVGDFLHVAPNTRCNDLSIETECGQAECKENNTPTTHPAARTGACSYELWNSIAAIHSMVKNFHGSLRTAGEELSNNHVTFIGTFAPKADGLEDLLGLFLSLVPVPLYIMTARMFSGALLTKRYFSGDGGAGQSSGWEAGTTGMIGASAAIGKDALDKAAKEDRSALAFTAIYAALIKTWQNQTDILMKTIFDGSKENIDKLTELFRDGKLIKGKGDTKESNPADDTTHTDSWNREKNIQRAFYAAAIPAIWTANGPAPVIVDFGPGCEIDARSYFGEVPPEAYNVGWRWFNQHSYILAGVRDDSQTMCGPNNSGDQGGCNSSYQWTFDILHGINKIPDDNTDNFCGITVSDLMIGALNTYNTNGQKNLAATRVAAKDPANVVKEYDRVNIDIREPGLIRIPVCGAEEAKANLALGRKYYGESTNYSTNYPCNP
ncbi:hypothetical protein V493_01055 [Pseudogymnoascus sp. VKM F-4281 (FW-2241)]|nr:hypothetical protein V493_01055 [Pseudogymnoascus sp. VKM F-4281 (FW-2241)]